MFEDLLNKIREGDIVYHKSNDSVKMIVVCIFTPVKSRHEYVRCRWLDLNQNVNFFDFRTHELIKDFK